MRPALGEAARLELVEQGDHGAAVDARDLGELLLGHPRPLADHDQDAEVARMQTVRRQQRRELGGRAPAEVAHEEAGELAQLLRWTIRKEHGHRNFTLQT